MDILLLLLQVHFTTRPEKENITEELKSNDQMLWVQKMKYIRNRVTEIVIKEIIYA